MDSGFFNVNTAGRGNYIPFYGTVTAIEPITGINPRNTGCSMMVTVEDEEGQEVNFVVSPGTFVLDYATLYESEQVIMFYDGSAPAPLIYPPRYRAVVVAEQIPGVNVAAGYFNNALLNADQTLKLNLAPSTEVVTANNQRFMGNVGGHNLVVVYQITTRSIPAQTTPDKVVVMCAGGQAF